MTKRKAGKGFKTAAWIAGGAGVLLAAGVAVLALRDALYRPPAHVGAPAGGSQTRNDSKEQR